MCDVDEFVLGPQRWCMMHNITRSMQIFNKLNSFLRHNLDLIILDIISHKTTLELLFLSLYCHCLFIPHQNFNIKINSYLKGICIFFVFWETFKDLFFLILLNTKLSSPICFSYPLQKILFWFFHLINFLIKVFCPYSDYFSE